MEKNIQASKKRAKNILDGRWNLCALFGSIVVLFSFFSLISNAFFGRCAQYAIQCCISAFKKVNKKLCRRRRRDRSTNPECAAEKETKSILLRKRIAAKPRGELKVISRSRLIIEGSIMFSLQVSRCTEKEMSEILAQHHELHCSGFGRTETND